MYYRQATQISQELTTSVVPNVLAKSFSAFFFFNHCCYHVCALSLERMLCDLGHLKKILLVWSAPAVSNISLGLNRMYLCPAVRSVKTAGI